jgi:hypothetical protein
MKVWIVTHNTDECTDYVDACGSLEGCRAIMEAHAAGLSLTIGPIETIALKGIPPYLRAETNTGTYWTTEVEVRE